MEKYLPKIIGGFINFISYIAPNYAGKQAISLFSKPRKGKLTTAESEYLDTAIQKEITCKDIDIKTYHWKGDNKTILLAHGWESNAFRWKGFLNYFESYDYNVIALDAPAHGGTSGKEFNAILYSECIAETVKYFKPEIIIGHSVGGMATVFALKNHKLPSINRIVLLGAPDTFENILVNYETIMGYNKRVKASIRTFVLKRFGYATHHFATSQFIEHLDVKGLIIHDKRDRIIPFSDATEIHKQFKNATLISTQGYGHGLKSGEVYQHISHFLKD
ncbi:alpha/beta fold hydrolase [Flavobacteriaceae bacterium MHTCC 0001]